MSNKEPSRGRRASGFTRAAKRQRTNEHAEEEATEDDKDFISKEAHELWNKILFDKDFVGEGVLGN